MLGLRFVGEIFLNFFTGLLAIFVSPGNTVGGFFGGFFTMINPIGYIQLLIEQKNNFHAGDWVIAIIGLLLFFAFIIAFFYGIVRLIRYIWRRYFTKKTLDEDLIKEIARLNGEVSRVNGERDRLLAMNGMLDPNSTTAFAAVGGLVPAGEEEGEQATGKERFYKLLELDALYHSEDAPKIEFDEDVTLDQFCDNFRAWACKERHLYYEPRIIRLFVAALATTRLVILQGISGTGKTSLPYALGQFLENPATIASVQPSWRDRTEIFGYFNEFTKRYNETEILRAMYEARWNDDLYLTVIDEANISRIEYYFAELLSIYELPSRENWVVDLCTSGWDTDPEYVVKGRFRLPFNMWYVATINNDDSTFAISDKVYDRAIPININSKGIAFEPDEEKAVKLKISNTRLEQLFAEAQEKYKVSEENIKKFNDMDDYVIAHFRLAFGNRIVKQLKEFIPVFVACGGTEIDGLDYVLCNKILRKFVSLNLSFIRDEIDGYIDYLNTNFGVENMTESKEYLERLKKLF